MSNYLTAQDDADQAIADMYTVVIEARRAKVRWSLQFRASLQKEGIEVTCSEWDSSSVAHLASMEMLRDLNVRLTEEAEKRLNQENPPEFIAEWPAKKGADEPGFAGAIRKAIV